MKKYLLFLISLLFINTIYSQELYSEDFNNFKLGNLGTDPDGLIAGQQGWFTYSIFSKDNSFFTIKKEVPLGNQSLVLSIPPGSSTAESIGVYKTNLNTLIDQRLPGNDVIKFEIEVFRGFLSKGEGYTEIKLFLNNELVEEHNGQGKIFLFNFNFKTSFLTTFDIQSINDNGVGNYHSSKTLSGNTWFKLIAYLDYVNGKIYFEIPELNLVVPLDFLKSIPSPSDNLIEDFKPTMIGIRTDSRDIEINYFSQKYDNIKITALKEVPPEVIALSTSEYLSNKFNLYPNPATNVVNITNNENMVVKQVMVYDITGKLISTQFFNEQKEIQLNVENWASGTYLLHLQTNEGTAVKKLVKK